MSDYPLKIKSHFSHYELECSCCHEVKMDTRFMELLEAMRVIWDKPMKVTSGYRCDRHNAMVSSTGNQGPHVQGKAVDINVYGESAYALVDLALTVGFTGIGVKQSGDLSKRFIHLDIIDNPRPRIWSY